MLRPTLFTILLLGLAACGDTATFDLPSSSDGPQSPINPGDGGVFEPGEPGSGDTGDGTTGGGGAGGSGAGGSTAGGNGGDGAGGGTPPGAPVPEPATMLLFGTGAVGLGYYRRRKANQAVEQATAE